MSQVEDDSDDFLYQQDGAPPYYRHLVRGYLSQHLPQRWIARTAAADQALLRWPPRSPDLTPCFLFASGDLLRTLSFYRLYHRLCLSCEDEASLPSRKSIVTCCSGYGRK